MTQATRRVLGIPKSVKKRAPILQRLFTTAKALTWWIPAAAEATEVRPERNASRRNGWTAHQINDTRKFGAVMGVADRDAW